MPLIRRSVLTAVVAVLCAAAWLVPAWGAPPKKDDAPARPITIVVNGEELARDPAPRIQADRVMVPVVRIYSALGIGISREGNTIVASAPSKRIAITVGSSRATVDARTIVMDAPATEIDGATYVTLRFAGDEIADAPPAQLGFRRQCCHGAKLHGARVSDADDERALAQRRRQHRSRNR